MRSKLSGRKVCVMISERHCNRPFLPMGVITASMVQLSDNGVSEMCRIEGPLCFEKYGSGRARVLIDVVFVDRPVEVVRSALEQDVHCAPFPSPCSASALPVTM